METLNNIVLTIQNYMSNIVLIIALAAAGIWFSIRTGFIQVRGFKRGIKQVFGGLFSKKGDAGDDGMSSFQALATAIAAQVGTGYRRSGNRHRSWRTGRHLLDVGGSFPWHGNHLLRGSDGSEI